MNEQQLLGNLWKASPGSDHRYIEKQGFPPSDPNSLRAARSFLAMDRRGILNIGNSMTVRFLDRTTSIGHCMIVTAQIDARP
ncbi:hypothetical protein [Nocardia sp. NPDC004711]